MPICAIHRMPKKNDDRIAWFQDAEFRFGLSPAIIAREAYRKWGIKRRQVNYLLARARKQWHDSNPRDLEAVRAELDGMNRHVYAKALATEDYRAANACLRELRELHGAGAAQRVQIEASHTVMGVVVDPAQIREQIRQGLMEKPDYVRGLLSDGEDDTTGEKLELVVVPSKPNGSNGHGQ